MLIAVRQGGRRNNLNNIENKIKTINDSFAEALGMRYDSVNRVLCGKRDGNRPFPAERKLSASVSGL